MEVKNKRCEVCCEHVYKYKCPRCSKQTCSVKCVNAHKTTEGCSGQRDKAAFVPINKFTENHLFSDYRFLEDVDRTADNAARNSKKFPYKNHNNKKFLKKAADRKDVQLLFLPNVFTKHKRNSSRTFKESPNTIFWCINWTFPQSDYAEILERKISDKLTFTNVLKKYLHTTEGDPIHRQRLKEYISENIDNVEIYMEYDKGTQQNKKYYKLDLYKSIEENLKGKLIIEYPTIHVVLKCDAVNYETKVLTESPVNKHTDTNQRIRNVSCEVNNMEGAEECEVEESVQCDNKIKEEESIELIENHEEERLEVRLECGVKENRENVRKGIQEESITCDVEECQEEDTVQCKVKETLRCGAVKENEETEKQNKEQNENGIELTKHSSEQEEGECSDNEKNPIKQ